MNIFFSILRKYFKEILIVGLIVVILLMRACSGDSSIDPKDIVTVDGKDYELLEQKIDTVFVEKVIEVPKYVNRNVSFLDILEPIEADPAMHVSNEEPAQWYEHV